MDQMLNSLFYGVLDDVQVFVRVTLSSCFIFFAELTFELRRYKHEHHQLFT